MRLFIAIEIPKNLKEYISKIQEEIEINSNKIRFIKKEQIHLTLKFLGEVQPNEVIQIKNILKNFNFSLKQLGFLKYLSLLVQIHYNTSMLE